MYRGCKHLETAADWYLCGKCKAKAYCSELCAKKHWEEGHSKECGVFDKDKKVDAPTVLVPDYVPEEGKICRLYNNATIYVPE